MFDPYEDPTEDCPQKPVPAQRSGKPAAKSQLDFELEFFERILEHNPDFVDVLRVHGNNLTAKGHYARGLETDRRLAELRPKDPLAHYNLACTYSLLQMKDSAIVSLDTSLKLGYQDFEHMLRDPDLEHVRTDARFISLLGRYLKKPKQSRRTR